MSVDPPTNPRRLVLIGMMASGKTTIGRLLSEQLAWTFADNDELLQATAGETARDIAVREGPQRLLEAEVASLQVALAMPPPIIIAAAAGVVLEASVREQLKGMPVIWLRADPGTLLERVAAGPQRPHLDQDSHTWLRDAERARASGYEALAMMEIRTDQMTPADAVGSIIDLIQSRSVAL
jgi:shikimate kinase